MGAVIELENAGYTYPDGTRALESITLKVREKDRVAVIGPNGSGKSTLLMLLAGLFVPTSGTVRIFNVNINKKTAGDDGLMNPVRKRIGIVFQDPDVQLFSPTVFDDIAFGLLYQNKSREEIHRKVNSVLRLLGIESIAGKHPYALSGGEKRKAALATALVLEPDVLLLDEPTADLDPESKKELVKIVCKLQRNGKTTITATHDTGTARKIASKAVMLNRKLLAFKDW